MKLSSSIVVFTTAFLCAGASTRTGLAQSTAGTSTGPVSILLLPFESTKPGLGDAVILDLEKLLDRTDGYEPVSVREAARRLPKYTFKSKLNCIHGRQIAVELRADFMTCGSIEQLAPARYSVHVTIFHMWSNSSITLSGIEARTIEDAAQDIARRITKFADQDIRLLIETQNSMHVN